MRCQVWFDLVETVGNVAGAILEMSILWKSTGPNKFRPPPPFLLLLLLLSGKIQAISPFLPGFRAWNLMKDDIPEVVSSPLEVKVVDDPCFWEGGRYTNIPGWWMGWGDCWTIKWCVSSRCWSFFCFVFLGCSVCFFCFHPLLQSGILFGLATGWETCMSHLAWPKPCSLD